MCVCVFCHFGMGLCALFVYTMTRRVLPQNKRISFYLSLCLSPAAPRFGLYVFILGAVLKTEHEQPFKPFVNKNLTICLWNRLQRQTLDYAYTCIQHVHWFHRPFKPLETVTSHKYQLCSKLKLVCLTIYEKKINWILIFVDSLLIKCMKFCTFSTFQRSSHYF